MRKVRARIKGTKARPRLCVFRSNKFIYAQIIDDEAGKTLVAASERDLISDKKTSKVQRAELVGKLLAQKAIKKGVETVVFDRRGFRYHGRVKALAEGAREGGLRF